MKFVFPSDLRDAERRILSDPATPPGTGLRWMREASAGVAAEILALRPLASRGVLVLAGTGNNGGDGFGTALALHARGVPVAVWLAGDLAALSPDAAVLAAEAASAGIPVLPRPAPADWLSAPSDLRIGGWRVTVDALLGTGVRGEPRPTLAAALGFLRALPPHVFRVALDVPSGWDAASPLPPPWTPPADLTVTVGFPKKGFLSPASRDTVGALRVVPFSLPRNATLAITSASPGFQLAAPPDLAPLFPRPPRATHKGNRGRLLIFAGSAPMPGAAVLATRGALRGGAGVVHVSASPVAQAALAAATPQAILAPPLFSPLSGIDLPSFRAILAGPGLGRSREAADLVSSLLASSSFPLVLDADALAVTTPAAIAAATRPVILTPHPAELARLLHCTTADIQADRPAAARTAAAATHATIVLKGDATLVASPVPDAPLWINLAGTPAMARGGSGDVLAGLLASLLATGTLTPGSAACAAVYLHALAGELAAARLSSHALNALDLPDSLPAAFSSLVP